MRTVSAQIRYFNEVARTQSITQAAHNLHVAASAISRQIRCIEDEVGAQLFERQPRGVVLTAAGRIYARYARDSVFNAERVRSELEALMNVRRGHVRLHAVEGAIANFLARALARFSRDYPNISFDLTVTGSDEVIAALISGNTEIGIAFDPTPNIDISSVARIPDPLCAVVGPDSTLAGATRARLHALAEHPIAIPTTTFGIRHIIDFAFKRANIILRPRLTTNSIDALRSFALYDDGVTFLTPLAVKRELSARTLVAVPVDDRAFASAAINVCVLSERQLPVAGEAFVRFIQGAVQDLQTE